MRTKLLPVLPVNPASMECLRVYLVLPLFPVFTSPLNAEKVMEDIVPFAAALANVSINKNAIEILSSWFSVVSLGIFERYLHVSANA